MAGPGPVMDMFAPPPRKARPQIPRSFTAKADLSPPSSRKPLPRSETFASQWPAKKHHLDFLHGHSHRRAEEKSASAFTQRHHATDPELHRPTPDTVKSVAPADVTITTRKVAVRPIDVIRERERGAQRDDELRESLNTLSEIAHNSTRQLDTIYYSLLEKIGVLRSTIGSLQELSTVSNKLHHNFRDEVRQLEVDVRGQVDSFRGFNGQQERIEELDGRIKAGQDRVKGLSERLEECRKQAEAWEKREREWQARTSKRLNYAWGVAGAILVIITLLLLLRRLRQRRDHVDVNVDALRKLLHNHSLPSFAVSDLAEVISGRLASTTASTTSQIASTSDRRLAAFDEL